MALRVVGAASGSAGRDPTGLVRAAEQAVLVLDALAAAPGGLSVCDFQKKLGVPRTRVLALLRTLVELRWVEAGESGLYGLGPHALLAGAAYLDQDPVLPFAHEALAALRAEVGHMAHFGRLDGGHVLYLASSEPADPAGVGSLLGRRLPAHLTALGRVLLAERTRDQIDELLPDQLTAAKPSAAAPAAGDRRRQPAATVDDRARLHDELDWIRARSWAFDREQSVAGVACVASVVANRVPATDAIGCSLPACSATDAELTCVVEAVVRHARRLADTLRREGVPQGRVQE